MLPKRFRRCLSVHRHRGYNLQHTKYLYHYLTRTYSFRVFSVRQERARVCVCLIPLWQMAQHQRKQMPTLICLVFVPLSFQMRRFWLLLFGVCVCVRSLVRSFLVGLSIFCRTTCALHRITSVKSHLQQARPSTLIRTNIQT